MDLPIRDEHEALAREYLGPGFWDRVGAIHAAPLPEVEEFPPGICRAADCDVEILHTGRRGQPRKCCEAAGHKAAAEAAYMRWYRTTWWVPARGWQEKKDALVELMNAELLPLIRKFHDRAFRGWMRVDERRADAKRQLEALGMRVIENTAANRQRLAAKYVKAAQRGGSPQEFYPDQSGAWLVVETDPLIWNPFAEALGSRLAWSSADGKIEVRGPVFDPDQADEPRNDVDELLAAVFPTQSSYVVTAGDLDDNEITWYDDGPTGNDDLASRAAAYGTEWQGWEYKQQWNPKTKSFTERREPRFEVGSPSAWLDRDGKTVSTVTTEEEIIGRMQGKYKRLAWSDEQGCMSLTPAPWVHPRTAVPWMDPEVTADWLDDPDASAVVDWLLEWLGEGEEWVGEWVAEEGITLTQIPRI